MTIKEDVENIMLVEVGFDARVKSLTTYITEKIEEAKCNRRPEGKCKECISQAIVKELNLLRYWGEERLCNDWHCNEQFQKFIDTRISQLKEQK